MEQRWLVLTAAEVTGVLALNNADAAIVPRLIDNPYADELGYGDLLGLSVAPARLLTDQNYSRYWSACGGLPTLTLDCHEIFLNTGIRRRFVSAGGNDSNSGEFTAPLATLQGLAAKGINPGDRVYLERGATFYGQLPAGSRERGTATVTIAPYGSGPMPIVSCYKGLPANGWSEYAAGVWSCSLNTGVTGNTATTGAEGANIGFLKVDGVIKPVKRSSVDALSGDWDFYSDGTSTLYVKLGGNPGETANEILAAPRVNAVDAPHQTVLRKLEIGGAGGHGVRITGKSGVTVEWCHIHEIGGSYLGGTTRYGNGVEAWLNSRDIKVHHCLFGDIYDTATTAQGQPVDDPTDGWFDCHFDDNTAYRCSQAFEVWSDWTEGTPPAGSGFRGVTSLRWTIIDGGKGDLGITRPDVNHTAPLLLYGMRAPMSDITVSVAEMRNSGDLLIFSAFAMPDGYQLQDSALTMKSDQILMHGRNETASQFASWVAAVGFVSNCTMSIDNEPQMTPRDQVVSDWLASL